MNFFFFSTNISTNISTNTQHYNTQHPTTQCWCTFGESVNARPQSVPIEGLRPVEEVNLQQGVVPMTNQMLRLYAILADAIVPEPQATAATTAAAAAVAVAPESKESKESKGEDNTTTATTTTTTATVNVGGERTDAQYWLSTFDFDTCIIPFLLLFSPLHFTINNFTREILYICFLVHTDVYLKNYISLQYFS